MFDPAERDPPSSPAMADPSVQVVLQAQLDQLFAAVMSRFGLDSSGNPPKGQMFVDRTVPVGVHLLSYSDDEAQVAVLVHRNRRPRRRGFDVAGR